MDVLPSLFDQNVLDSRERVQIFLTLFGHKSEVDDTSRGFSWSHHGKTRGTPRTVTPFNFVGFQPVVGDFFRGLSSFSVHLHQSHLFGSCSFLEVNSGLAFVSSHGGVWLDFVREYVGVIAV